MSTQNQGEDWAAAAGEDDGSVGLHVPHPAYVLVRVWARMKLGLGGDLGVGAGVLAVGR